MAQGPKAVFPGDRHAVSAAVAFIDGLLANPPVSLDAGPGEGLALGLNVVGGKPPKQTYKKGEGYVIIRMLGQPKLEGIDRKAVKNQYVEAGWSSVSVRTSFDGTHTKVTLYV